MGFFYVLLFFCWFTRGRSPRGGEAPLDLINGHLSSVYEDVDSFSSLHLSSGSSFVPVDRVFSKPDNWFRPFEWTNETKGHQIVACLQPFHAGGYEVSVSVQDLERLAMLSDMPRKSGKREKREQNENDVISSINRSKKKLRHLIKSMGCDRLLTLTVREQVGDQFLTIEEWSSMWTRFVRLCRKNDLYFDYVSVFEKHKKGNYHMHAAINGNVPVKTLRALWLTVVGKGRGAGNVDIKFRPDLTDFNRRAGCARYVSKYLTKQQGLVEFNKKRYYCSKHSLPEPRRYILNALNPYQAIVEIAAFLGLDCEKLKQKIFMPESAGNFLAWFSFDDSLLKPLPF